MIEIFLSYCSADKNYIDTIIDNLHLAACHYKLWYYNSKSKISMYETLEKLRETDLFVLIVSNNSLGSPNVQEELKQAIELRSKRRIKGIYPIMIDNNIDIRIDGRIPQYIKGRIYAASSPVEAAKIIEEIIKKY